MKRFIRELAKHYRIPSDSVPDGTNLSAGLKMGMGTLRVLAVELWSERDLLDNSDLLRVAGTTEMGERLGVGITLFSKKEAQLVASNHREQAARTSTSLAGRSSRAGPATR